MAITQSTCPLGSPIILGAAGDKLNQNLLIREAVWTGCTTAANVLVISDYASGVTLYTGLGVANQDTPIVGLRDQRLRNGIKVTTMDAGQLLLYL